MRAQTVWLAALAICSCLCGPQLAHGRKPVENENVKFDFKTQGPRAKLGSAKLARVAANAGKSIPQLAKLLRDDDDLVSLALPPHTH